MNKVSRCWLLAVAIVPATTAFVTSFSKSQHLQHGRQMKERERLDFPSSSLILQGTRRDFIDGMKAFGMVSAASLLALPTDPVWAALQDSLDIDTFLRTGQDMGGNMGVSSQAGKSRPQTGVVFRDGTEVSQDGSGNVLAEILVGTKASPTAVLTTFQSPWALATGPVYDVETRDAATGDGVFLAVTQQCGGKSVEDLSTSFLLERLFSPTGRFSFYGPPTDIRAKRSTTVRSSDPNVRYLDVSFSTISQATNTEIPRKALLAVTIPAGTDNAVMLVGSASTARWNKGVAEKVQRTIESFRATAAPRTSLKVRPKERGQAVIEF